MGGLRVIMALPVAQTLCAAHYVPNKDDGTNVTLGGETAQ
jgi:hypothetical protein